MSENVSWVDVIMVDILFKIPAEIWKILLDFSPFLIFGFLIAGILSAIVSTDLIEKHLGEKNFFSIFKAALFGIPLPVCSCGVIPIAASLKRSGASNGAIAAFMISTPQTGIDSFMIALALLGPTYAVFIPVAAFISSIIVGLVLTLFSPQAENEKSLSEVKCEGSCCTNPEKPDKFKHILYYGFVTIPKDITTPLLIGLLISGIIAAVIPAGFFTEYFSSNWQTMLLMMLIGIPLYVCASSSIPIAAVLIAKGISPGAALVFLMTGPATNAATFATLLKIMGKKSTILFLLSLAMTALLSGLTLDYLFNITATQSTPVVSDFIPEYIQIIAVIILGIIMLNTFRREKMNSNNNDKIHNASSCCSENHENHNDHCSH